MTGAERLLPSLARGAASRSVTHWRHFRRLRILNGAPSPKLRLVPSSGSWVVSVAFTPTSQTMMIAAKCPASTLGSSLGG